MPLWFPAYQPDSTVLTERVLTSHMDWNAGDVVNVTFLNFTIAIVRQSDAAKGFEILLHRWVVERTLAWIIHLRQPVKDYEQRIDVAQAMIHIAIGSLMQRRNAHP
ncbi:transposase [Komagataeibacter intermedius TF2]|uniref:Transposase n=1 Tax=Komagataeibacter intermedius NRIC 0521 TaxID=1307934 RepID=A0ABQ0PP50_9PROT|nr:transposase [Komagataeibacter intermedius TF2]GBQ76524.1 transposase [Komagataeibacter intermedius NRIC 0521]